MSKKETSICPPILCTADNDRVKKRFRVMDLFARNRNLLGSVVDLSTTGMRVFVQGKCEVKKDQMFGFTLKWGEVSVLVRATVAWIRPISAKEHLVGLQFEPLNASEEAVIGKMTELASASLDSLRADQRFAGRRA